MPLQIVYPHSELVAIAKSQVQEKLDYDWDVQVCPNEAKQEVVVVLIRGQYGDTDSKPVRRVGVARCHPNDTWDALQGMRVALKRAIKNAKKLEKFVRRVAIL